MTDRIEQIEARVTAIEEKLAAQEAAEAEFAEQLERRLKHLHVCLSDLEIEEAQIPPLSFRAPKIISC